MSNLFTINWSDFLKGLVMAILVPTILIIQQSVDSGILTFNWKEIGMAAIAGAVGFLVKKFVTNSEDKILLKENQNSAKK